jgi:TorA maturation chaperone TorD
MTSSQSIQLEQPDQGEEAARAELYSVLATFLYAPPTQDLLDRVASIQTEESSVLHSAWADLALACKSARQEAVREEYEELFIGVGKPEVMLYGSYYLSGFLMEKPLAELRSDLAKLGIERAEQIVESEDHIATLCEVMRYLIESDDVVNAGLHQQKAFFATHMQPWAIDCCNAIESSRHADFYKSVARLARVFFEVEVQAFDMM